MAAVALEEPSQVAMMSVRDLAEQCRTSEPTVIRFCQKVGYKGYRDFRMALALEAGRASLEGDSTPAQLEVLPDDDLAGVVAKVGALDRKAISDTIEQVDIESLAKVVSAIEGARRVEVFGVGASGLVALDLEQKLRRIGLNVWASVDGHAALISAALLRSGDVAIGISHSGEVLDVIDPLLVAGETGCATVAITNYPRSPLARAADVVLTTAARESKFRSGAMATRVAQLTIIDCVYLGVAQSSYENTLVALERTYTAVRDRGRIAKRRRF